MTPLPVNDTIVAIATPPGRGGIGIVRLSGPDALSTALPLLRFRGELEPQRARFCEIVDPAGRDLAGGDKLDEAVLTYYRAPRSYTGEDVLEIACHGAPVLLEFVLRQCVAQGARLAEPGEFTQRAFLSGRIDLTQAEAVRDLIDAQTLYQARVAASQMDGALSRRVEPMKTALIGLIAQLEAGIDFAEDDTPTLAPEQIAALAVPIADQLGSLARSFEHGRLVHQGLSLAIIGEPNVGKSSLFNALVERERAIVTAAPGTTRDLVTERISLGGLPLELIDTAGLRTATAAGPLDEAERIGIDKSRQALAEADLILVVVDATSVVLRQAFPPLVAGFAADFILPEKTRSLLDSLAGRPAIVVLNKTDLVPGFHAASRGGVEAGTLATQTEEAPSQQSPDALEATQPPTLSRIRVGSDLKGDAGADMPLVFTSMQSGNGVAELRRAIADHVQPPGGGELSGMLTDVRQHQAVTLAAEALMKAIQAAQAETPQEMVLLDLYSSLAALDSLTGVTTPDHILGLIFSTFCIGK